jgi:hypothetical protein
VRRIAVLLAILLSCASVATAQTPVVTKAVDDATKATTDVGDATNKAIRTSIWFTGANIDPRDISDRIARQVGRLVLINSSNTEIGTSNSPLFVAPGSGASFAVTGAFWQATQPISATSLPLPSGASTSAKQPALGVAGTASADVLTVQGIASMTALKVDGSATTQPVSGTVTATQGGTWTVQPGNTANTTAWKVDGSAVTQPVSIASTVTVGQGTGTNLHMVCDSGCGGAASFADNGAFTAGTTSVTTMAAVVDETSTNTVTEDHAGAPRMTASRVLYVDLKNTQANATALKVDGSAVTQPVSGSVSVSNFPATQPISGTVTANIGTSGSLALDASVTGLQVAQASTTSGQKGGLALGAVTTSAPTYTTAQTNPLSLTTAGALRTDASATTQPVSGTITANAGTGSFTVAQATGSNLHAVLDAGAATIGALTANQSVNQTQVNGVTVSTGLGVSDTGTQRIALTQEATYAASTTAKTATASGTAAFFELCGSGTKTIRLQRIMVSGTWATAGTGDIQIRKNSAAATGGTATTLTNTPYDSNSAAATATAKYFTVLPTGGATLVGNIMSESAAFPLAAGAMTPQLIYVWRDTDAEAPTLRGAAQCITAGFGTAPGSVPTLSVSSAWTEK